MSYNGYKNYATWNVCLWIDNDYNLYKMRQDVRRRLVDGFDAESAEDFVREVFPDMTPDMRNAPANSWDEVDWDEVADCFNEE